MRQAALAAPVRMPQSSVKHRTLRRMFLWLFDSLVYTQVWEDPDVDLEALQLGPEDTVFMIASAGCNALNYLAANPKRILAVDMNPHHVALSRLKIAALRSLPSYKDFFRFFGCADDTTNCALYDRFVKAELDAETRRYWDRRTFFFPGRRISMFAKNLYRYGQVGRFLGFVHLLARLRGTRLQSIVEARDLASQRAAFELAFAPMLDHPVTKFFIQSSLSFFILGIPPSQYEELVDASDGNIHRFLRRHMERLACEFPAATNYFAWQVFARSYDQTHREGVPPYLRKEIYEQIRSRTDRIEVHRSSMKDLLQRVPEGSISRFVLLDSQDWMNEQELNELWREINRAANPHNARVIFRTAGYRSPLRGKMSPSQASCWQYLSGESRKGLEKDRSSIYGGFHVYERKPDCIPA